MLSKYLTIIKHVLVLSTSFKVCFRDCLVDLVFLWKYSTSCPTFHWLIWGPYLWGAFYMSKYTPAKMKLQRRPQYWHHQSVPYLTIGCGSTQFGAFSIIQPQTDSSVTCVLTCRLTMPQMPTHFSIYSLAGSGCFCSIPQKIKHDSARCLSTELKINL